MVWTIDSVLSDELIKVTERDDAEGRYLFRVGVLQTVISVKINRLNNGHASFSRSHNIRAGNQAGPYRETRPEWDDEAYALHTAIEGITFYYKKAIGEGHPPVESWLVPA
jgi:hypothetical protein